MFILTYVIAVGLALLLTYHIWKLRSDPIWDDLVRWVQSSIGAVLLVIIATYLLTYLFPESDPYGGIRYVLIKVVSICVGIVGITGGILFVDSVTKGDWLSQVETVPYGPVALLVAFILAIAWIIVSP
jgi:hypothetical protein